MGSTAMTSAEIRAAQVFLGLTRRAFAELLGESPRMVDYWCSGKYPVRPDVAERVHELIDAANRQVKFGGHDDMPAGWQAMIEARQIWGK